LVKHIVT